MDILGTVLRKTGRVFTKLLQYGCVVYCASAAGSPRICDGESMEPTLHQNNLVLVETISAMFLLFKRGDVVCVHDKSDPHVQLCKRLVGLEYDRVFNNKTWEFVQVPKGHVWLEGDNQSCSTDSREMGPFPYALMKGRVYLLVIPTIKMVR